VVSPGAGEPPRSRRPSSASPSGASAEAPCGVGCCGSREHGRPLPRLRVRPFTAHDPAATTDSADSCRVTGALSRAGVGRRPSRPTPRQPSPDKPGHLHRTPAAFTDGRSMATGFAVSCRLALAAPPQMRFVSLGHEFASAFLPTPPRDGAVGLGLWLVPSPPQGTFTPERPGVPGVRATRRPGRRRERAMKTARKRPMRTLARLVDGVLALPFCCPLRR
jgi:hypothetical protein